ncbi:protein PROCA1 isoform X2 [Monodon monoceros]|uniref:protein PROCA1 isoform X2 n=1 Tax=Monodon monoceros TaxID=40151 RepID=UPI0010F7C9DE|nr:protein PROCA1 isoform X2 [Monodon monoceros]XP_029067286.1 protein PROCA1 isoform X2 [Monodon monoceros]XP_029067288.1 protein PROCA1 isoform X2 [Monodon monoceros]XP_029067289.1 protein PROCA1 isoform X2 [Monodon monoceros]
MTPDSAPIMLLPRRSPHPYLNINRLPSWERGHLLAGVASSTDASTFSSEGEFQDTDGCCWKHRKRTGRVIHPFTSDYGHHAVHLHSISHCDCESRLKDCSEKTYSSSGDVGLTCSQDVDSACFNIIQCPCFELIPEGECVERFWCGCYRPLSVAVIHHPIHRECGADYLNQEEEEKEEEEEEEESKPPIPTQVGPPALLTNTGMGMVTGTPDLAAPITIWRSERPTGKSQGNKMIKKIKKKKGKEKDKEEETDEKAKVKKKVKKGKLTKKKSPVKSESPPDLNRSLSPRELARMSESSPDSWRDLESEDSYNDPGREEPSSEDIVESLSPRKREKNGVQAKKPRMKTSPVKKVNKRKSPPASNPNLS